MSASLPPIPLPSALRLLLPLALGCGSGTLEPSGKTLGDSGSTGADGADGADGSDGADGADGSDGGTDSGSSGPLCAPSVQWEDPWYAEGETVELEVVCASGEDPAQYSLSMTGLPEGASLDGWSLSWTTGMADAGRYDPLFSVSPSGGSSGIPETVAPTFWVAEIDSAAGNIAIDPLLYTEEWGLPVFHITAASLDATYRSATVIFDGDTYSAEAKIRGAASYGYPENSYTLRFADDEHELDVEDWGIPEKKDHLVLITTFDDNSMVRQKLSYDLWAAMAEHAGGGRLAPRTFFAVVYLNGRYHGLYTAIDRIDDEFVGQMGFNRDGNLYKSYNHDANFKGTDASGNTKYSYHQGYYKKEGLPLDDFSDIDALVKETAKASPGTWMDESESFIATDEFMDWFLFVHFIEAGDSGGKNAYLYNDPTAPMRFHYCPWDFNHAYGQDWMTLRVSSGSYNDYRWNNQLFVNFQDDAEGNEQLWGRYQALRTDGVISPEWFAAQLDEYYALIEPSGQRQWDKWGGQYNTYWWASYRGDDWTTYTEEKEYLYTWLDERMGYFDEWYAP